ncbi:PH (Pleckstrin Homology) domain-containing protein [Halohasta litchfieldiae]|jgi:uncharacterized membrane protein YdbT with pleckstrin-like domain|uniref:PH domain-containing protein n=1 Tax=Halohasta litchfieldiae TaxID=1073996 RepID=A0A1H6SR04_9EURY|nr:PH domain-containing protein [Halohasta litchfieldiae]ATW89958.1 PH (Pleckstrin Homology) domain-containing protein [Halohasta litchfieldiae]SEI66032.1 PH domain-containing protein [Halohasta litchfieldiae]
MAASHRLQSTNWLTLTEGETIEWTGRPSLFTVAPQLLGAALVGGLAAFGVSLLGSVLSQPLPPVVRVLPLLAALSIFAVVLANWYRVVYVITSEVIYIKRGFVSLDVDQIRLARVQNTTLSQSVRERLLGYGDVVAFTAGSDTLNIELKDVPNPSQVNQTLSEQLHRPDNQPQESL